MVTVLVEVVSLVWGPAKDATVPNLVPPEQLEAANQISLATTYGSALPAAALFAVLTLVDRVWPAVMDWVGRCGRRRAVLQRRCRFVVSGLVIARCTTIPRGPAAGTTRSSVVAA